MSLYMEATKISSEQTVAEIQKILGRYGASAIMTEYENGEVTGLSFRININGIPAPFKLPCRSEAIFNMFARQRRRIVDEKSLRDQAKRVAWRQILRWVEAQLAIVQTDMVTIQEVFLPYLQTGLNETLYQRLDKQGFKMLESK